MQTKRNDFFEAGAAGGRLGGTDLLLACLAVLLGAAYIPLVLFSTLHIYILTTAAYLAAGVFLAAVIKIIKNVKLFINVIIGSVFLLFIAGVNTAALVLSLIAAVALPAFLMYKTKSFLFLLPFAASAAAVFAATGQIIPAAFSLFPILPALLLYAAVKKGQSKAGALASVTAGYVVTIILGVAVIILLEYGKISADIIKVNVEAARTALTGQLDGVLTLMFLGGDTLMTSADITKLAEEYVTYIFNYLPAITVIVSMALAFLSHSVVLKLLIAKGEKPEKLREMNLFAVSAVSAGVFLAMRISALILGFTSLGMYSIAAQNLAIIIEPAMVLTAMIFIQTKLLPKLSCSGFMLFLGVFFLFIYLPFVIFPMLSLTGALYIIITEIKERKKRA